MTDETTTHVFGHYENARSPVTHGTSRPERRSSRTTTERVDFGLSLERPLWRDVSLLAGFRSRFQVRAEEYWEVRPDEGRESHRGVEEELTQSAAWGVRGAWGNFDLVGAMRMDLSLGDLFLRIDAGLRY